MTEYHLNYAVVASLGIAALLFGAGTYAMWWLLRPKRPTRQKLLTYECGIDAVGQTWTQPNVRYYVFALLFVIFDVEVVFMFPWALVYEDLGLYSVVAMIVFVVVIGIGLVYAWGRRQLEWI